MTTVQRKTDRVAIASLVLGMIPIAIVILTAIFDMIAPYANTNFIWRKLVLNIIFPMAFISAIICGHIARSRIKKYPDTLTGSRIPFAGLVMGYTVLICTVLVVLPNLAPVSERAHRVCCMSQQRGIWKTAVAWGNDHSNSFPPDLQTLVKEGCISPYIFICPSSGRETGSISQVDHWSDYIIVSNRNLNDGQAVLIYEKPDCHNGKGGHVTMANGSSTWYNADEYKHRTEGLNR